MAETCLEDLCVEITYTCPNNCKFCSSNANDSNMAFITYDDFKNRIIDPLFAANGGIKEVSLSGGEPFLHPGLEEMISYCKSLGIRTVVFTSGLQRTEELSETEKEMLESMQANDINRFYHNAHEKGVKIKNYYNNFLNPPEYSCISKERFRRLKEIGLDKVVFDLQSEDGQIDNYLMGRTENMRTEVHRSIYNAATSGISVDIHFVPMKPNYKQIGEIIELLSIVSIPQISILGFVPQGRGLLNVRDLQLTETEYSEFISLLNDAKSKCQINVRMGKPLNEDLKHECTAGTKKLVVTACGKVYFCPALKNGCMPPVKNIYTDDLSELKMPGGTRPKRLCKEVYNGGKND